MRPKHPALLRPEDVKNWIDAMLQATDREYRFSQDYLSNVFSLSGFTKTQLRQLLAIGSANNLSSGIRLDLVSQMTISFSSKELRPDAEIPSQVENFFESRQWWEIFSHLPEGTIKGGARSEQYEKALGKFAKLSRRIRILDPYFAGAMVEYDKKPDRLWLIQQLASDSDAQIEVISKGLRHLTKRFPNLTNAEESKLLSVGLDRFGTQAQIGPDRIKLRVISNSDAREFHNRSMQFSFDQGQVSFALQEGLDHFMADPLQNDDCVLIPDASFSRDFSAYLGLRASWERGGAKANQR